MDKATEEWYEHQFIMFTNTGWKDLIKQATEMKETISDISRINNNDSLQFVKGQLDILNWLTGWENKVDEVYKELKDAVQTV